MTKPMPSPKVDLLLERYAKWHTDYTGEPPQVSRQQVHSLVEQVLQTSDTHATASNSDACQWAWAISSADCAQWSAVSSNHAQWDPLHQDLDDFLQTHPDAELALIPNALPFARLVEFLSR